MPLTEEQSAVVAAVAAGKSRVVVEAGAGAGKTSTIVAAAKAMPRGRGMLTVFNKMMAEETKPRLAGTGCEASTLHSVAWRSPVAEPFKRAGGARLNVMLPARDAAEAVGIRGPVNISREIGDTQRNAVGDILKDWVARYCQSANEEISAKHFPRATLKEFLPAELGKKAEEQPSWFAMVARAYASALEPHVGRLWDLMSKPDGDFPTTHDVYLKLFVMSRPRIERDYVMLDEAQDANPIMLEFMRLAAEQGAQTVYVGDSHQQMYSWRGAVDALRQIDADVRLRLTQSFRFGPEVAAVANAILGDMLHSDFRLIGAGRPSRVVDEMAEPTAVVCRTNAKAIEMALAAREAGVKAGLCMNPKELIREVDTLERFQANGRTDARRYRRFASYDEMLEAVEHGDAPDLKILLDLIGEHNFDGTRMILSEVAVGKTPGEIGQSGAQTVFLTGHASKGLQFRNVQLGDDFKGMAKLDATPGANRSEELNILYVATTRAQEGLCLGGSEAAADIRAAIEQGRMRAMAHTDEVAASESAHAQ